MSSKKKPTISTCEKCQCTVLVKDFPRHTEICGSAPHYWEMSVIKPRCIMKGFVVQFEKWDEYLPPDTCGWLRRYSVFMHPQAMEILGINARQPVRVQTPVSDYIGVVWPCKEIGILRISLTEENGAWEKLACITPIWNSLRLQRISLSIDSPLPLAVASLQEYIQMYLSNSYIQPGIAIPLNYYGKVIQIVPDVPLELALKDMSLEDGELESMDEFSEKYTLIPPRCVVILDWPSVDKEHKGFSKLVQLIDNQCAAVVLSVRQAEELDLGVRVRFPVEVEVDVPMEEERIEILRSLTGSSDDVIVDLAK
ncbi:hypothetical protein OSTOST_22347 [Ostertagia ostertagi]